MKNHFMSWLSYLALVTAVLFLAKAQASTYDVKERAITLDDRFKVEDMLRPYGHDFIIDITAGLNTNALDFYNDANDVSKTQGSDSEKLAAGQAFLRKYRDTEQTIRFGLNLGAPLPSFSAFDIKFVPNLRVGVNLMVNLGVRATQLSAATILNYVGSDLSSTLKDLIVSKFGTMSAGDDIVAKAIQGESPAVAAEAAPYLNKYYYPSDTSVPDVLTYAKADAKVGFYTNYEVNENFFGNINLYGMGRADTQVIVTADSLSKGSDTIDFGEEMNTNIAAVMDYQLGYRNGNLRGMASVEELKIATISDNKEKAGDLNYEIKSLFRLHGDYRYDFSAFTLRPFAGAYKRSGYNQDAQPYGGLDFGTHVWDERIGLQVRGMVDEEHLTLTPRLKLWLMQLEYSLKQPLKSKINDTKVSTLHSLNFRLFF